MAADPAAVSPVFGRLKDLGARFVEEGGWSVAQSVSAPEDEVRQARQGVALVDESARGKLLIQGPAAGPLLSAALGLEAPAIERGVAQEWGGWLYRLRQDLFFASTSPGRERRLAEMLRGAGEVDDFVTVTDVTHGRSELRLIGPQAAALMSKVCALDFHPSHFDRGSARQTSVAKTRQLVTRRDAGSLPAYAVLGGRSLAGYLWDTLMEAGAEFGIASIGLAALRRLDR